MICDDSHRLAVNVQVEVFALPNNGESLSFGLAVASLYRSERPACISNHVFAASGGVCLGKDGSESDWAGIDADFVVLIRLKVGSHWGLYKGYFELLRSVFMLLTPFPRAVSLGQLTWGLC